MNKERNEPIFGFDMELIADFFCALDRQGPGGDEQTLRALEFLPPPTRGLRIADIGCGTGRQTGVLARRFADATITAVDLLPEMIDSLDTRMRSVGLGDRVTGLVASMEDLRFEDESFDVIWAEGSIYNIGFEKGLRDWRRLLKPGGSIAVTECSWIAPGPFPQTEFIRENFPDIATVSEKLHVMEQAGYVPLAHFILPRHCWTENYYARVASRIPVFLQKHAHSPAAVRMAALMREEAEHYRRFGSYYGYVFYIGRKPAV